MILNENTSKIYNDDDIFLQDNNNYEEYDDFFLDWDEKDSEVAGKINYYHYYYFKLSQGIIIINIFNYNLILFIYNSTRALHPITA